MLSRKQGLGLSVALVLLACGGLDPGAFRDGSSGGRQAVAGFAFDAGTPGGSGGRDGSAPAPQGGASGAPGAGSRAGEPEGGAAGEPSDGGAPGEPEGGAGGRSIGAGALGLAGGVARAGAGGSGGGNAGASARGGQGGLAGSGGVTGASGTGGSAGSGSGRGGSASHALYLSEYVEGSSSYKALELAANADATLAGCRLVTYFNGAATGSGIVLDGAVSVNAPYVLCSTQLATLLGAVCARTTNLTYNGDDAVALECDGEAIDVIGQVGVDPGDAWGSGEATTLNHTLRRRCPAVPDTNGADAFDPAAGWDVLPVDTFDGLGRTDCAAP